jgi:DNA-binding protein H-NS
MNIEDLIRQKEALEKQIQEAQRAARGDALAKIRELMTTHGLTLADLTAKGGFAVKAETPSTTKKVAAKYRNPATGETWTGRGLKPKWLAQALTEGKSLDEFLLPVEAAAE